MHFEHYITIILFQLATKLPCETLVTH